MPTPTTLGPSLRVRRSRSAPGGCRGFTIANLIAVLLVLLVIVIMVGTILPSLAIRKRPVKPKDAANLRSMQQACVIWANSNREMFPLPSMVDRNNATVAGPAAGSDDAAWLEKDNTGNVLSLLIFNGNILTDTTISPAEASGSVMACEQYEWVKPRLAVDPKNALWDPGYSGTAIDNIGTAGKPAGGRYRAGSNNSYAVTITDGGRKSKWRDNLAATDAVFANRGPRYAGTDTYDIAPHPAQGWALTTQPASEGANSVTLSIFGNKDKWGGNVAWNDNHVTFETRPDPIESTYKRLSGTAIVSVADNLFIDEDDEVETDKNADPVAVGKVRSADKRTNNYLRPVAQVQVTGTGAAATVTRVVWRD